MTISHILEDFSNHEQGQTLNVTDVMLEDEKLNAFEKGYKAGWEDSLKSASDSTAQVSADFAQNLRDLSFTYHEASSALLAGLKPLIEQIVNVVLPEVARSTLGIRISDLLNQELEQYGQEPIEICVASNCGSNLESLIDISEHSMPLTITEDPSFAEGQAQIRFGQLSEREIDLQDLIRGIESAVQGFFEEANYSIKEVAS